MPRSRVGSCMVWVLAALLLPGAAWAQRLPAAVMGRPAAPQRVLAVLQHVAATLRTTAYTHSPRIDARAGRYEWDCSVMAAWVLARAAPAARAAVGGGHPLAVDFFRTIQRAPTERVRGPWLRVARVRDARPGDVLAWQRPRWFPSRNTGHVAFVVGVPVPVEGGYLVRIADATSVNHEDDTRRGGTGFGLGTILVTTDPATGAGTGYGWVGRHSNGWVVPTPVAFGRVVR